MGVRNDDGVWSAVPEGSASWMNIDGKGFARPGERTAEQSRIGFFDVIQNGHHKGKINKNRPPISQLSDF
jgi:hypothetical protein